MRAVYFFAIFISFLTFTAQAQTKESTERKSKLHGQFFFNWGYHRDAYSKSTIHFEDTKTANYNFTLHQAKAKDQPDWDHFLKTAPTVPQYILSGGYFFNDKHNLGIELSWNHLKYVVRDNQKMHLTGMIDGEQYDVDTLVTPKFVHFEHTNGNNYLMISLMKRFPLLHSKNDVHHLHAIASVGGGGLIPKTSSSINGLINDGPFRLSGYVLGASTALRYEFFKYLFLESSVRGAFANYTSVKLYKEGRAKHHFFSVQYMLSGGFMIPMGGH